MKIRRVFIKSDMKTRVWVMAATVVLVGCGEPSKNKKETVGSAEIVKEFAIKNDSSTQSADAQAPSADGQPPIQVFTKHALTDADLYLDYSGGNGLAEYFVIELIDKKAFMHSKDLAVNQLTADSSSVQKSNGVIHLACQKRDVTFTDNLSDNSDHKEFSYIGEFNSLNVYLLSGIYWEDWNYFFVDKTSGKTTQTFAGNPYLSPDLQYLISVDFDTLEGAAYIGLYEVQNHRKINQITGFYIKKWVPITDAEKMFWSNDNYFYVPVVHNADYWAADGNYTGLEQYIRLKPAA